MQKVKTNLELFLTMLKVGLFTFGGGYAMIAIMDKVLVEKKKWLTSDEFLNVVKIAEATPGPLAINMATFVGFKRAKFLGSLISTIGVVIPSFVIITLISFFFDAFTRFTLIHHFFLGIKVGVTFLIVLAGAKMFIKMPKTLSNLILFFISFLLIIIFSITGIKVSSIYFILVSFLLGVFLYLINYQKSKKEALK